MFWGDWLKLILELEEDIIRDLHTYAELSNLTVNEAFENLFNIYIKKPVDIVEQHGIDEIQRFLKLLTYYLNEVILDSESLIGTDEEFKDDKKMVEVFKVLNKDVVKDPSVLTALFKVYKESKTNSSHD